MKSTVKAVFSAFLGVVLLAIPASADVIFDQQPVDGRGCGITDFGWGQQELDNFSLLPGSSTITDIHWWGAYGHNPDPAPSDNFRIRFFDHTPSGPNVNPFLEVSAGNVSRALTGLTASVWGAHDGGSVYYYSLDFQSPIVLNPATTYYLSIVNNTDVSAWGWLESVDNSHWYRSSDGSSWNTSSDRPSDFAFQLTGGSVPEPATMILLGLGLCATAGRRFLRRG